jgi:hypothetical protein
MRSSGSQAADFIKVLAPTIKNAGLSTKITCCDSEGWENQRTMTAQLISAGVESSIGVITSHSYTSSPSTAITTSRNVWETEYADLSGAFSTDWHTNGGVGEGLTWAQTIYKAIVGANVSGYLYWIGAETGAKNSALISISGSTITPSKRLWAFAMYSRFVRPGAVRVGTSGSGTGLQFAAFKNKDGTVAVIVINSGSSAQTVNVAPSGFSASSVKAYITDNSNAVGTLSSTLSGGQASANVPAYSMVTFVLSASAGSTTTTSGSTTTTSASTTSTTTTTPTGGSGTVDHYGQCGGQGWTGGTVCVSPYVCTGECPCVTWRDSHFSFQFLSSKRVLLPVPLIYPIQFSVNVGSLNGHMYNTMCFTIHVNLSSRRSHLSAPRTELIPFASCQNVVIGLPYFFR